MSFYIKCGSVFIDECFKSDQYVLVENQIIREITVTPNPNIKVIDYSSYKVLPGFLDLHIHGREGADVMDAIPEAIEKISTSLAKHGVVGFLATTVTTTWEKSLAAFKNIGECYLSQPSGAQVLGAYNEGLFFTEDHKGAHDEQYFQPLTKEKISEIIVAANGSLKVVALAPELPNSDEVIKYLSEQKIIPMLGHTNATFKQTNQALCAGACGGVHVFNGMRGIHHREPGCAGAVLLDKDAYVEVIADGIHLHPGILSLIHRMKGSHKMGLISDCIVAGGMKDGDYKLGMLDVKVEQGIARTMSGSLAGSTLSLEKAVKNMINMADIAESDAINMATIAPARFLGINDKLGSIDIGKQASFTIVDENYEVIATFVAGSLVYKKEH
ncbi:N-acetylglucosamine-6-phosphate deacetylase [Parashewanella tropica]|uniref:N-acetylglucosamine-6-phosphate deacetylase n=1 Tax=Parashewanella tropica TaxID=2547970 RepID=UPI0010597727|nr:N-acetylglucosamine-6-phosphate deacetylase [Parashewanella tropica]